MGSFSVAGYNRAEDYWVSGGGQPGNFPYVTWTISWNPGSTVFTITASKSSGQYEMDNAGLWSGYIWWGDFATVYNEWDSGQAVIGNKINKWALVPDKTLGPKSYSTTVSLGVVPTDTAYIGFSCDGEDATDECGYVSGYVEVGKASAPWNPIKTITVKEVKKNASGAVFDYGYYTVDMHSSWTAAELRPPSEHTHPGYTYSSCTSVNDIRANTTLYLIYNPILYYATFNGGTAGHVSNLPASRNIEYEGVIPPSGNDPVPTKTIIVTLNAQGGTVDSNELTATSTLRAWKTTVNGTSIEVAPGAKYMWTSALTFNAQWTAIPSVTLPVPAKLGYRFVTWGVTSDATSGYRAGSFTPSEDVTLYAIWKACGIAQIFHGGRFHNHLVWLYKGDGLGPNNDGWHTVMPKIYMSKNGVTKFFNAGGDNGTEGGSEEPPTPEITAPTIKTHPTSVTAAIGESVSFSVAALGTDVTYQWYYRTSSSGSWTSISGATSGTYTLTTQSSYSGRQYRCAASNSAGTVYSNAATLTVVSIPQITTQPVSTTVVAGNTATFSIVASGTSISYQWYYRASASSGWVSISGATGASYSFTATAQNNNYQYRCIVSNTNGSVTSDTATLTVDSGITAYIYVTYPTGSTCTASDGSTVLQPYYNQNGVCRFLITKAGSWTVTSTDGTSTASNTMTVADGQTYTITLVYGGTPSTISATVRVSYPTTATSCVMVKGSTTVQPSSTQSYTNYKYAVFNISQAGLWTIQISDGTNTASEGLSVQNGNTYDIALVFDSGSSTTAPVITSQPTNQTVVVNANAVFTVVATGSNLTYQWCRQNPNSSSSWISISGATSATYTLTAEYSDTPLKFHCIVRNNYGSAYSYDAVLTVCKAPEFGIQPSTRTTNVGNTVNLYAYVMGNAVTGTWQYRAPGTSSWSNVPASGYTQETRRFDSGSDLHYDICSLSFTAAATHDFMEFRCKATNIAGTTYSNVAIVGIFAPTITTQPEHQTVVVGSTATFTVGVSGYGLSYQWYKGTGYYSQEIINGATSASYSITATASNNDTDYFCTITNLVGSVSSRYATLTSVSAPTITTQPESVTIRANLNATFTFVVSGNELTYQWYYRTSSSGTWTIIPDATSSSYTVAAGENNNGYQYRCTAQSIAGTVTSNTATLTVRFKPTITTQPADQTVVAGTNATFTVVATGGGLTYQWHWRDPEAGQVWHAISGATSATYVHTSEANPTPYKFRCTIENIAGSVTSEEATLIACSVPAFDTQPSDRKTNVGNTVRIYCTATGNNVTGTWQYRAHGTSSWSNVPSSGYTQTTTRYDTSGIHHDTCELTFVAEASHDFMEFRCKATNIAGTAYSNVAKVPIFGPTITTQPADQAALPNTSVTFTVVATGKELSYQWYKGYSVLYADPISGATSASYTVTASNDTQGGYICVVTNVVSSVTSSAADLDIIVTPTISTQPSNTSVKNGTEATFSIRASGNALSYQWQYRTGSSGTWTNCTVGTYTEATYTFTAYTSDSGRQYRCIVTNAAGTVTSNAATLSVRATPAITVQPVSQTIVEGNSVTFTAEASGGGITYQWYKNSTHISGANSSSYTYTPEYSDSGDSFYCKMTNDVGSIETNTVTVTVCRTPTINSGPSNRTVSVGNSTNIGVNASGHGLSVTWQYKAYGASSWSNVPSTGYTSSKTENSNNDTTTFYLNFTAAADHDYMQFRAKVTNIAGSVTSGAAYVYINAPTITTQPTSMTAIAGNAATFTVVVSGRGLTYQWYKRTNASGVWNAISGATSASYSFTPALDQSGTQYFCVIENAVGSVDSNIVTLTVVAVPTITTQPTNKTVVAQNYAIFTIAATGNKLSYQWYSRTSSSGTWAAISGATGTEYSFATTTSMSGYQYRCIVSNSAGSATSNTVTLTVVTSPTITTQPANKSVTSGSSVTFSIAATGGALSYQWYSKASSGASPVAISGATSASYTFTPTASQNGYRYLCTVRNAAGTVTSNDAILTVNVAPAITTHPASQSLSPNSTAIFTVVATGTNLTYQWQSRASSSGTWANSSLSGNKTATLSFTVELSHNGSQYRCVVSNGAGSVTSNVATLTAMTAPTITTHPVNKSVAYNTSVTFTVVASGSSLSYQWYYRTSASGTMNAISGATSASYTVTATTSNDGYYYCCKVSNPVGSVTSGNGLLDAMNKPTILQQPSPTTIDTPAGQTITLTSGASGESMTSTWQYRSSSSGSWTTASSFNVTTNGNYKTLSFTAANGHDGYQFRFMATNGAGTVYSNVVTVNVVVAAVIIVTCSSPGTSCTATKGSLTLTGSNEYYGYYYYFEITHPGLWTITASNGSVTRTDYVDVNTSKQYNVTITF